MFVGFPLLLSLPLLFLQLLLGHQKQISSQARLQLRNGHVWVPVRAYKEHWKLVWVRFPALPDFLRSAGSGTGSTQPSEYN
jgi:hypothetical protein